MTRSYNGLIRPDIWPPKLNFDASRNSTPVNYISPSNGVINIDVGRQLFVDDFLIEKTSLSRVFYSPKKSDKNPILLPTSKVELDRGECPVAAPFNDGVWWDDKQRIFKMWYHAGWMRGTAYAESNDGLHWERPDLDIVPGSNLVLPMREGYLRDGGCVWLDSFTSNSNERFKMFQFYRLPDGSESGEIYTSADGVHWNFETQTGLLGDNSTFFYNPFIEKWVYSIRTHKLQDSPTSSNVRTRLYREHSNFVKGATWDVNEPVMWSWSDHLDHPDGNIGDIPQLYDLNAVPYESLMLGLFSIFYGPDNQVAQRDGVPKINDLQIGFSRDGFHWDRTSRDAFIPSERTKGSWDRAYIHAAGGVCLVVGDELFFYYGAWSGESPNLKGGSMGQHSRANAMYAGGSTGLAVLRRDGFASLTAGSTGGALTTKAVNFSGNSLFVNCDTSAGQIKVEILDSENNPISPFILDNCFPISVDSTKQLVSWKETSDMSTLRGKQVKFKMHLVNGEIYSFWVSQSQSGKSNGYVAAGGPEYRGSIDTGE